MNINIIPKILIDQADPTKAIVVIRKVVRENEGIKIYALEKSGEWVFKPEGKHYADECLLPAIITKDNNQ